MSRASDDESLPERSSTLLPSSVSDHGPAVEVSGLLSGIKRLSYKLLTLLNSTSSPSPTPEEVQELERSRGYHKLIYEKVDDFPKGYPQLSAFANSCDTFANVRRFGRMSYRVIAQLQNDLTRMEKELDELDIKDSKDKTMEKRLRGYENFQGWDDEQRKLLLKIEETYSRYAGLVLKDSGLRALGNCPQRNTKALFTWVWNRKPFGIEEGKSDFIFYPEDFVSLAGQTQPFHNFIESYLDNHSNPWITGFLTNDIERRKTDDKFIQHYSTKRLTILANILEVSFTAILLLIPICLLFLVPMSKPMMAMVVSMFGLLFSVIVATVTGAKVEEVFFRNAIYAIVIIMFFGNLNS